jgi:hypothetical protein
MKTRHSFLVTALLCLAACATTATLPKGQVIGEKITPQASQRFAIVDASPKDFFNKTVLVEATIKAVCQQKGCWMQVEDQGHTAMVRWESGCGGQYSFPKDAAGKRVLIQGSFYPKHIDAKDVAHMEGESGTKLAIPTETYEFNASSVLILGE